VCVPRGQDLATLFAPLHDGVRKSHGRFAFGYWAVCKEACSCPIYLSAIAGDPASKTVQYQLGESDMSSTVPWESVQCRRTCQQTALVDLSATIAELKANAEDTRALEDALQLLRC